MDDFIAPHATRIAIWDVYLLPVGLDIFGAQPDQLRAVTVEGRNAFEAANHPDVLRLIRKQNYVVDTQPSQANSAIVNQIRANARARLDAIGRAELEAGATSDLVRGIVGSRGLGSGW
jgi:hypothetical protein